MKTQNFERELPSGYRQVKYINAKDAKLGIIFNLVALAVLAVVIAVAWLLLPDCGESCLVVEDPVETLVALVVFLVAMVGYVVLHELVHGIAYKSLTDEKLTFGMSWSCAYCGVPNIYTYRRTALISLVSPLIVFSAVFIALTVALYFVSPIYYLMSAFLLGLHLGGCSGDIYCTLLFLFKFKDKRTLMRDTGPEQFFYVPLKD
ncbi:MAG: DUF3267 domain-containing protein [Clostridia bacterium]|nr:DUF3267 domain-containing protein [Clostridia bacterium]